MLRLRGVLLLVLVTAGPFDAGLAQSASRWSVGASADVETIPNAFSTQCNQGNSVPGLGAAVSLGFRPTPRTLVQLRYHETYEPLDFGCDLVLPIRDLGNGVFEDEFGPGYEGPRPTFGTGELGAIFNAPATMPPGRLSVGVGEIHGKHTLPVASLGFGIGTRGSGTRISLDYTGYVSRVLAVINRPRFRVDTVANTEIPLPPDMRTYHAYPRWSSLELTLEIPLGAR